MVRKKIGMYLISSKDNSIDFSKEHINVKDMEVNFIPKNFINQHSWQMVGYYSSNISKGH